MISLTKHQIDDMRTSLGKGAQPFTKDAINSLCALAVRGLAQPEAASHWHWEEQQKPEDGEEVLVWHVLGDQARSPHAFDVACWINDKWIFPWDRGLNPHPQWVRAWMPLPFPPDTIHQTVYGPRSADAK